MLCCQHVKPAIMADQQTDVLQTSSLFKQRQGLSCAYEKVRGTKNWAAIKIKKY